MARRFWDTLTADKDKSTPTPWWLAFIYIIGIIIGFTAVMIIAVLFFLLIGYPFSLLWNYTVSPIFEITEINAFVGGAFLFLVFGFFRLIKFALRN